MESHGLEGNRDGRKLRSPLGDRIVHGMEPQSCGVQVVEWVGLIPSLSHKLRLGLAAVFAEEVGGFGFLLLNGQI